MVIIASYFAGETYGLLGPQMAATVIQENTSYECIVVGVAREDDKTALKKGLADYFGRERPVIGFSTLSGRQDLFALAKELKDEGVFTILAGPQADVDYIGEKGWEDHDHRFKGVSDRFSLALHGPAEQAIELLQDLDARRGGEIQGLLCRKADGEMIQTPRRAWDQRFLAKVNWGNFYRVWNGGIEPIKISAGQVLQQIGCPHAAKARWVELDYPASLAGKSGRKVRIWLKGSASAMWPWIKASMARSKWERFWLKSTSFPKQWMGGRSHSSLSTRTPFPASPVCWWNSGREGSGSHRLISP